MNSKIKSLFDENRDPVSLLSKIKMISLKSDFIEIVVLKSVKNEHHIRPIFICSCRLLHQNRHQAGLSPVRKKENKLNKEVQNFSNRGDCAPHINSNAISIGSCHLWHWSPAKLTCKNITMLNTVCLLYTSPSPRDLSTSRMPSSA